MRPKSPFAWSCTLGIYAELYYDSPDSQLCVSPSSVHGVSGTRCLSYSGNIVPRSGSNSDHWLAQLLVYCHPESSMPQVKRGAELDAEMSAAAGSPEV